MAISQPAEELIFSTYGLEVRVVDAAGAGLCPSLRSVFPPEPAPLSATEEKRVSYLVGKMPEHPGYSIARNESEVFHGSTAEETFRWLQRDIDDAVAQNSRQKLFVHAGVVAWRGLAILVVGRSFTGKSTLVAELVRRGAVYYSDEFAVLDQAGSVHPYARPLVLRDGERRQPRDLRLFWGDTPREPLPVGLIVAAPYQPHAAWRPNIVLGARAVLPLIDSTVLAREEAEAILRIAARIAPAVVTLQGPRPEAAEVAPRLLDLIDDALVSRAMKTAGNRPAGLVSDLAAVARLRLRSQAGRPAPSGRQLLAARYLRIPDFLSADEHQRMLDLVNRHQAEFQESGIVDDGGQHQKNYGIRNSRTLSGPHLETVWDLFARRLRDVLPHVRKELGIPWFPCGEVERQLTAHADGGFFAPHVDNGHPVVASRRISCVYYFHASPQRFTGGELRLSDTWVTGNHSTAAATHTTIAPLDNSIVFFRSDSFHEVCPVERQGEEFGNSRFAVTIWFREGQWPALFAAPAHSAPNVIVTE